MFEGAYTALITPFTADGQLDLTPFKALIEEQIKAGISGIVPVGTTGESPTLNIAEHKQVIETAVETASGRVKVIAGTGGNSTSEALELTKHAKEAGADASLQVTPYYNKPNQEGLTQHFLKLADVGLPIVLYNVPGRSARELDVSTVARCFEHPNIVAVKEASGDAGRVSQYKQLCDIEVLSGDDPLTLPMMSVGAIGVISVASNVIPGPVAQMVQHALDGKWPQAQALHHQYHPLFEAVLKLDTNPIPVKTAWALIHKVDPIFRLPLCGMSDAGISAMKGCLHKLDLV